MSNEYKEWLENHDYEIKDFIEKYCNWCGSQRCEGPHTDWAKGCRYYQEYFEVPYETANNRAKRS